MMMWSSARRLPPRPTLSSPEIGPCLPWQNTKVSGSFRSVKRCDPLSQREAIRAHRFSPSSSPGKLAILGRDPNLFPLLDKQGHRQLQSCLQPDGLGDAPARRVPPRARLCIRHRQLYKERQLQADGIAVVFVELDQRALHQKIQRIAHHLLAQREGLEAFLVEEVRSIAVAIEV